MSRRLLALRTAPALRAPFVLSVLTAVFAAFVLDIVAEPVGAGVGVWMTVVAPVLPLVGVALSYGPGLDPTYEMALATARGGLSLLLWRILAVLVVCLPAAVGLALLTDRPGPVLWVLPSLALTLCTLAVGTVVALPVAASVFGGCWAAGVVVLSLNSRGALLADVLAHPAWPVTAAAATVLILARRQSFHTVPR